MEQCVPSALVLPQTFGVVISPRVLQHITLWTVSILLGGTEYARCLGPPPNIWHGDKSQHLTPYYIMDYVHWQTVELLGGQVRARCLGPPPNIWHGDKSQSLTAYYIMELCLLAGPVCPHSICGLPWWVAYQTHSTKAMSKLLKPFGYFLIAYYVMCGQ